MKHDYHVADLRPSLHKRRAPAHSFKEIAAELKVAPRLLASRMGVSKHPLPKPVLKNAHNRYYNRVEFLAWWLLEKECHGS
jgi:hypothetical protein